MVFNSPCLTDKKELIHHKVEMVINSPWIMPLLGTKGLASPEQTATVVPKSVAGLRFSEGSSMLLTFDVQVQQGYADCVLMKNKDAASSRDIQLLCAEFLSIQVKTQSDWMLLYVVPAGKVIIILSPGRVK
ncbi:hypothetical protein Tco_1577015 [Tanacetum coccineum]